MEKGANKNTKRKTAAPVMPTDLRLCLIGEGGKSALVRRQFRNKFFPDYDPTIEDYYKETFVLDSENVLSVEILDTGNEIYQVYHKKWIEYADGFLIVYGVDSKVSLDSAQKKYEDIMKLRNYRYTPLILVGNKSDITEKREVSAEEGKKIADYYRCNFIETSAQNGENVNEAFRLLIKEIHSFKSQKAKSHLKSGWIKKRGHVRKNWKKRFFILTENSLRYYTKEPQDAMELETMKGMIPLASASELEKFKKEQKKSFLIILRQRTGIDYFLELETATEAIEWEKSITEVINKVNLNRGTAIFDGEEVPITQTNSDENKMTLGVTPTERKSIPKIQIGRRNDLTSSDPNENKVSQTPPKSETVSENIKMDEKEVRRLAVKKFNNKPKDGIQFLIQNGIIKENPLEVAKFLKEETDLRKSKIGEYLGEGDVFNKEVLIAFVALFDFAKLPFDDALRKFLSTFRLPGEAQKIDRMMECFANRYVDTNPGVFEHPDTAYVLAFALIMLNTDAHNPSVLKKMTIEQFISNNRGINNGKDIPSELLVNLYNSIVNNEIQMEHERDDISKYDKQGWLHMLLGSSITKKWKKRFCIISGGCLFIFNDPKDASPIYVIPLANLCVEGSSPKSAQKDSITIFNPKSKMKLAKLQKEQKYTEVDEIYFTAENWRKKCEWMLSLQLNSRIVPNYDSMKT